MDLSDKICLVTGANTGLGFAISKKFVTRGAQTVMVCRNKNKGEQAVQKIKEDFPEAKIELMICDLSSLQSIAELIKKFNAKYPKLDILYNNAAVMKQKRTETEDGIEMMFQVNFLAGFILMNSFLNLLQKSKSPFIINNGRPADKYRLDLGDLQFSKKYNMYNSFFLTKLCLLFTTLKLANSQMSKGITVTMIDPGPFKSDLVRDVPLMGWMKNLLSAKVEKAADNIMYHIYSDAPENINGKVFKEKIEKPLTEYWKDKNIAEQVWTKAIKLIENKFEFTE